MDLEHIVSRPGAGTIVVLRRPWENDLVRPATELGTDELIDEPSPDGASSNGVHDTAQVTEAQNA